MAAVTARPTVWLCPLSCPPLLLFWIDTQLRNRKCFGFKSIISMLDWNGTGEGIIIRLFGTLFVNTVTICNRLAVHRQPITPPTHTPNSAFHPALFSRASYPECIFSTSGLGGGRAPHLCCISALIKLSTTLLMSHESRKWLRFSILLAVSQPRRPTRLHQTYSEQSEAAPPLHSEL